MGNCCTSGDEVKGTPVDTIQKEADAEPCLPQEEPAKEDPAPSEPKLSLTIVGARGLRASDWLPGYTKPDCYCEVKTGETVLFTTKVINDTCEPVWFEKCEVKEIEDGAPLEFWVYDKDLVGSDFLGKAILESKNYAEEGYNGELKLAEAKVDQAYIKVKVKVAGKDLPAGPPPEFSLTVEKPEGGKTFGLDLDTQSLDQLYVLEVKPGPFTDYNGTVGPEYQVKRGDVIVSVNGKSGSMDHLLEQFKSATKVECVVRRTVMTSVVFDRGDVGEPLGFKVPNKPQGDFLLIMDIAGGAAQRHNETCKEQAKFCPNDRVFSVGPLKAKAGKLLETLQTKAGPTMLTVARVAQPKKEKEEEKKEESGGGGSGMHWLFG